MRKKYHVEWRCKACGEPFQTWTGDPAPTHDCGACGLGDDWLKWSSKHRAAAVMLQKEANGQSLQEETGNGNDLAVAYVSATRAWLTAWGRLPERTIPATGARLFGRRGR